MINNAEIVINKEKKIILRGDWGYFIDDAKLKHLKKQISKFKYDIHIIFDNLKPTIAFMLFLKNTIKNHKIKKVFVYTNDAYVISLLSSFNSSYFELFLNNSRFTAKQNTNLILNNKKRILFSFFESIGKYLYELYRDFVNLLIFIGMFISSLFTLIIHPKNFKFNSFFFHVYEQGFKALPIGLLTSLIISYVITMQGIFQLSKLGVPLISIDTTAKLSLREMGPFILALLIAGRSASSFTAQIGSMKLTEELSTMKIMNFNIFHFLIIPRVLSLIVTMPLMVFAIDSIALLGSMLSVYFYLDISFGQYIERFYETVEIKHFWVGIIKAPFFGAIIGIVGCLRGIQCSNDTQSIGKMTTKSVVNSIFWLIFANALFSIIFISLQI